MRRDVFSKVGGRATIEQVHRRFYDKVFAHPWLSRFFEHVTRERLESQQTDFIIAALGGPDRYSGMMPKHAHRHMFITAELFDIRHDLLRQAIEECRIHPEVAEQWLKIDAAFGRALIKRSRSDCTQRYPSEPILDFPRP